MPAPLIVGPFELSRVLGTGGMGDVWAGRHINEDFPVAVKVLRPRTMQQAKYLTFFRNEVRAIAGLSHPNIIEVYDYGQVSKRTAAASDGKMRPGSPWLAMELANHGSLLQWRGKLDWTLLKRIMVALLDALAHAHARGVIHRDLKGANVLVAGPDRVVKLADFGLANPIFDTSAPDTDAVAGTPWYMAPEQFAGKRQDQGPWTDLYAFGCLAWALLTGAPPYPERGWADARVAHLTHPLPPFDPRIPVPRRTEEWLRSLLQKAPQDRFRAAADAAWALTRMEDPPKLGRPLPPIDIEELPSSSSHHSFSFDSDRFAEPVEALPTWPRPVATLEWELPPFPADWRPTHPPRADATPLSVGLGLYGMRDIPMVGREDERDLMWRELRRVRARQRPSTIIVRGQAGCGKSAIARWISERATELGVAIALRGDPDGDATGVGRAIARYLRVPGLDRDEVRTHLQSELRALGSEDEDELAALIALVAPRTPAERVRFQSAVERWAVVQRFLERLCAERPVILWIDDAHRDLDSIAFTDFLLELSPTVPRPILVVLTSRDEDLVHHPIASSSLSELANRPSATPVALEPLDLAERRELVRRLLGLEARLAGQIEERTGGNPLFTVQLIGDLVERGVLVPGKSGFKLQRKASLNLPADLRDVWKDRLDRLLAGRSSDERTALELAAILGLEVDPLEWHALCTRMGVNLPDGLVDAMFAQRLVQADEAGPEWGWSFVHAMLRETVEAEAKARDIEQWRRYHREAAALLGDTGDSSVTLRLSQHLLSGGQPERALGPLLDAATQPGRDARMAEALLVAHDRACSTIGLADTDPRRLDGWIARGALLVGTGRESDAARWASRALDAGEQAESNEHIARALGVLAEVARVKHRFGQSLQLRRRSMRHALIGDLPEQQAEAMKGTGRLYLDVGNWTQAASAYTEALRISREAGLDALSADCLTSLGYIAVKTGNIEASDDYFLEAGEYVHRSGSRVQQAHLLNALADLARKRGDFAVAESHSHEALKYYLATGTRAARVMMLNLSLFQVLQSKFELARKTIESALQEDPGGPEGKAFIAGCMATLLPCLAHAREWQDWYGHLETIGRTFSGDMFVDDDTMAMLELAASMASEAGQKDRAMAAWRLALELWNAMGREDRADVIKGRMKGVG